jgi:hypothetical protein
LIADDLDVSAIIARANASRATKPVSYYEALCQAFMIGARWPVNAGPYYGPYALHFGGWQSWSEVPLRVKAFE